MKMFFLNELSQLAKHGYKIMIPRQIKQQSSARKRKSSPPPLKAKVQKSARKNIFNIFFMDISGMLLVHVVPYGQTVDAEYYA